MIKIYFVIVVSLLVTACELPQQRREIERQKLDRALADPSLTYEQKVDLIRRSVASKPGYVSCRPVIDPASCKNCNYEGDLIQCQAIARDNTNYSSNAIGGAAAGAGVSALIGAIAGVDVGTMAAVGATVGGVSGLGNEALTHNQMIARCMQGRGYNVPR